MVVHLWDGRTSYSNFGYDQFFTVEATAHNYEGVVDVEMLNGQFQFIRKCVN